MNQLTFSIPGDRPILCPICLSPLVGQVIWVYGNVVFCQRCVESTPMPWMNRIISRIFEPVFAGHFIASHGLVALSPKPYTRPEKLQELLTPRADEVPVHCPAMLAVIPVPPAVPNKNTSDPLPDDVDAADPDHNSPNVPNATGTRGSVISFGQTLRGLESGGGPENDESGSDQPLVDQVCDLIDSAIDLVSPDGPEVVHRSDNALN